MVAFAGRKYVARYIPAFVANSTYTGTSFTLVLESQKGRLQNQEQNQELILEERWMCFMRRQIQFCLPQQTRLCYRNIRLQKLRGFCRLQPWDTASFSGTDKHLAVLNSWYEVENLRQYSLYSL
ncbi:hypothetical protein CRYUN_Cryun11dG0101600 [Craigia yunnanensis]